MAAKEAKSADHFADLFNGERFAYIITCIFLYTLRSG